jgi:hypothetical protein
LEKNISILAKATQVSDVAHGPLVEELLPMSNFFSPENACYMTMFNQNRCMILQQYFQKIVITK